MPLKWLAVDLQNEFACEGGLLYRPRPSVSFIQTTVLPFVREQGYTIAEIVSDYRATPSTTASSSCVPGQWSYQSLLPDDVKHPWVWVKAQPSPAWIRSNGGQADQPPGAPYADPHAFDQWLVATLGPPDPNCPIVLMGLILEICVLATLQELHYRGYRVNLLFEGTDTYAGDLAQKKSFCATLFPFWGATLKWQDLIN